MRSKSDMRASRRYETKMIWESKIAKRRKDILRIIKERGPITTEGIMEILQGD